MHMHWCLRCNKPYAAPSTFCKSCQSLLRNQLRHKAFQTSSLLSERYYILPGEFEEKEECRAPSLPILREGFPSIGTACCSAIRNPANGELDRHCTTLSLQQEFVPAVQHENCSLPILPDMSPSSDALENLALEDTRAYSGGSGNSQSSCNTLDEVDNNLDQLDDTQPYLDPLTVRLATKKKGKRQENVGAGLAPARPDANVETGLAPARPDAQPVRHRRVVSAQMNGTIDVGQKGQMAVGVNTTGLEPGTYSTHVTVKATDSSGTQAQGSPQILTVTLTVYQPCSLQVAPGNLLFTATLLQPNPAGQNIAVKETGNCAYPVSWTASVDANSRSWLSVSSISGTGNSTIVVYASSRGMLIGQHSGQITFSATDNRGVVLQNSPQAVLVTLTVIG